MRKGVHHRFQDKKYLQQEANKFGSSKNATGNDTVGVTSYNPINTLLQKETIDGIEITKSNKDGNYVTISFEDRYAYNSKILLIMILIIIDLC